ncbi:hypothetical protein [Mesorhizobium sp. M0199]|uniref:hypothetical protein n=1 Tax=Mesorhizobium sp. M0199 TaxID=2956911 RepID=UPI003339C9AD
MTRLAAVADGAIRSDGDSSNERVGRHLLGRRKTVEARHEPVISTSGGIGA